VIFLAHTGCESEAKKLEEMVRAHFNPKGIIMGNVGPVVGSHAGPDAVALFFLGERDLP